MKFQFTDPVHPRLVAKLQHVNGGGMIPDCWLLTYDHQDGKPARVITRHFDRYLDFDRWLKVRANAADPSLTRAVEFDRYWKSILDRMFQTMS